MATRGAPMVLRAVFRRPRSLTALRSPQSLRFSRRGFATEPRPSNPTSAFYKTFTRPVAKVLVLAIFTYQLAYFTWAKLEFDENCAETDATIEKLEKTVDEYKASKDKTKTP